MHKPPPLGLLAFIATGFSGVMWWVIKEVSGNVLADQILAFLRPHFGEGGARVIANAAPAILLGVAAVYVVYLIVRWSAFRSSHRRAPQPEMPIKEALDYIVNDSREVLKKPEPWIENGQLMRVIGVEHTDALHKIDERAITGEVTLFGYRGYLASEGNRFESVRRPIPQSYWQTMKLYPPMALVHSERYAQTIKIPSLETDELEYTGLMLDQSQVMQVWHRKGLWRRIRDRMRRKPRIEYR